MPKNAEVKCIHITVRLGKIPRWEMRADERVNAAPKDSAYAAAGAAEEQVELLNLVLRTVAAAYPDRESIRATVEGSRLLSVE